MRKHIFRSRWAAVVFVVAVLFAIKVGAQSSATASQTAPVVLSSAATEVLILARSKVGEDTMLAFIKGAGATYRLGAPEIIYLKEQGVPDSVITAMLNQRNATSGAMAPAAPGESSTAAPAAPFYTQPPSTVYVVQPQSAYAQPSTEYVAPPEPAYVQPATVYAAAPTPVYPYYYPYYGFYPGVSFAIGVGYGGYRGYGGYHGGGGYHLAGGHLGGGYHGGGGHGGHR